MNARMGKSAKAALAMAVAATAFYARASMADIVINSFDDSDSATEVGQWSFNFGGGGFVSSNATLSFSTDDANSSATSGSLDVKLLFDNTAGDQYAAISSANLGGIDASAAGILMLDADVKAVAGSAVDQFGQSGFFNLAHRNGPNFDFESDYGVNLNQGAGWVHIDVPLASPNNAINAITAQVYDNGAATAFPGPNGLVEYRLDNIKFITTPPPPPPPGISRAGHQNSFENASTEIDSTHPGGQTSSVFKLGDSYGSSPTNNVDHTQSTLFPTDGLHSVRLSQANVAGAFGTDTQIEYNDSNLTKWNAMLKSTKMLLDITTPGHGPAYQTFATDLNFNGNYISTYGTNNYQFVDGNPGGDTPRTTSSTQTYTLDYGGLMYESLHALWPGISNYNFFHFNTGNGGPAAGTDPLADPTSEYFLDNLRLVDEDVTLRPAWQTTGTADWNSTNWGTVALATDNHVTTVSAPNGQGAAAIFYGYGAGTGAGSVNSTVTVSSAITVGSIIFDSQMTSFDGESTGIAVGDLPQIVNYTLSGSGSMTLDSGSNTSEIYAIAGNHTIAVPVLVNSNLEVDTSAGFKGDAGSAGGGRFSTVAMTSLTFSAPITLANGVTFTTHGAGTVNLAAVSGGSAGLVVYGGHTNLNGNVNVATFDVTAKATMTAGGSLVVRTGALTVEGTLDINDNRAIIDYTGISPITSIRMAIQSAYNGGSWNGASGITSSLAQAAAASGHPTAIGFAEATAIGLGGGTFAGQGVDNDAILIRYTYAGDANLDGKVNALDFNAIAANYGGMSDVWNNGDFNYDGTVSTADFAILAGNFGQVTSPAPLLGSLVPEPGSAALVTLGIGAAIARRRRSRA